MMTEPQAPYPRLLLEIGTEEIPARFLPDAQERIKTFSQAFFTEHRIAYGAITAYATPRRIALIAEIASSQSEHEKEIWGPPISVAFNAEGNPTKAAEAFAKSTGVDIGQMQQKEKNKRVYLYTVIKETAHDTIELLPSLLPQIILSLNFPKSMRWGNGNLRFARPIHWILALYQNQRVTFEMEGIKSHSLTRGHRFLSPAAFEIKDDRTYVNLLRNNLVIVSPDERKKMILDGAHRLMQQVDAVLVEDDDLLNHVSYLVEYPVTVLGTFSKDYLALPEELLITVMKDHQKYFAVRGNDGRLTNHFVVVSNTRAENASVVKKGAEKVLKARFEDARFYFEEDRKTPIEERQQKLKNVTFHTKLGSISEKTQRIAALARYIAEQCFPEKAIEAEQIGRICKNDLVSGVVFEFPELQGIMASYYASESLTYSKEAVQALREQYLPAFSGDRLPATELGTTLSLADKIDNIASFFMIGITPTGTEDPFALRRQALAVIAILSHMPHALRIVCLLEQALQPYSTMCNKTKIIDEILRFFEQRLDPLLQSMGYPYDAVAAVTKFIRTEPFSTIYDRLDALVALKSEPDYELFLQLMKRINNIAPKDPFIANVNPELFMMEEEKNLWAAFSAVEASITQHMAEKKYQEAIGALKNIAVPINIFFDKVLVMDKNESIKLNRLSLIKNIQIAASSIADFSKLV